ncbi:MAG TPA: protein kinase [Ktedonobacterales bacterium]
MAKQGPLSGQMINGKFQLGELLGGGGMGDVYQARDTRLNRPVAVKVMSLKGAFSTGDLQHFAQMFQAEALRLASLKHPSIPHIYEYFEEAGQWFLVMEFIEGETLEKHLKQRGGRLPVQETLLIGLQLATVLDYLHTQRPPIIFRDLKPANVMLTPQGEVYLIDFGIARLFTPGKGQDTFVALSQGYAAPEQYGLAQTETRSDIYSLGATLHHLLSGQHPRNNQPFLWEFVPLDVSAPAGLKALIMQMVQMNIDARPASMREVRNRLQDLLTQKPDVRRSGLAPITAPLAPRQSQPAQRAAEAAPLPTYQTPPRYSQPDLARQAGYLPTAYQKQPMMAPLPEKLAKQPAAPASIGAKIASALSYFWFFGVLIFFVEKRNRFVHFHALQSVLYGLASFAVSILLNSIWHLDLIGALFNLLWLFGAIYAAVQAYKGRWFLLPAVGKTAYKKTTTWMPPQRP